MYVSCMYALRIVLSVMKFAEDSEFVILLFRSKCNYTGSLDTAQHVAAKWLSTPALLRRSLVLIWTNLTELFRGISHPFR